MRLAFFDFNINYGGAPQGSVYLARRLSARHDVHVIDAYGYCAEYCSAIRQAGLGLHILLESAQAVYIGSKENRLLRLMRAAKQLPQLMEVRRRLIQAVELIKPDVIWVNNEKSLTFLSSSRRLRRYPAVMYCRGWATEDQVSGWLKYLMRHHTSAIIAHAQATLAQLRERGIDSQKLHYTPNTIDFDSVLSQSQTPPDTPLPSCPGDLKLLLPAARPTREKGHLEAVRAVKTLRDRGYQPILWLPGKNATGVSDAFSRELMGLIDELGLREVIHFIGWHHNVPALIQACDVVVLPTYTEGFPRAVLEAMLLKKPVCTTPVGGIPEAIVHRKTGLLSRVGDDLELANHIELLITDAEVRQHIVDQAFAYVTQAHHPDLNTQAVEAVFAKAAQSKSR